MINYLAFLIYTYIFLNQCQDNTDRFNNLSENEPSIIHTYNYKE